MVDGQFDNSYLIFAIQPPPWPLNEMLTNGLAAVEQRNNRQIEQALTILETLRAQEHT